MPLPQSPAYKYYPAVLETRLLLLYTPLSLSMVMQDGMLGNSHHSYYCHDYKRTSILSNFRQEDNG